LRFDDANTKRTQNKYKLLDTHIANCVRTPFRKCWNFMENTEYHQIREAYRQTSFDLDGCPKRYVFILTNKCNLSCSFCFQDRKGLPNKMTASDWIAVSDKLPDSSHITLTGGEPLAFGGFTEVLRHISKRHTVNIICNGVLLNKDLIDLFTEVGSVQILSVSIDTIGNYNRDVTPTQYEKMVETLQYLREKQQAKETNIILDTKTVVTDMDSHSLFDIYKHCVENLGSETHSFQFFKGSPVQHSDKMFHFDSIHDTPEPYEYQTIDVIANEFEKIRAYCAKHNTRCFSHPKFIDFSDFSQNYLEILNTTINKLVFESQDYEPCKAPWESVHINADGATFPCLAVNFGDIRHFGSVEDLFAGDVATNFRGLLRQCGTFQACHRCGYLKLAQGSEN